MDNGQWLWLPPSREFPAGKRLEAETFEQLMSMIGARWWIKIPLRRDRNGELQYLVKYF